ASAGAIAAALVILFTTAAWPLAAWTIEAAARDLLQREFIEAAVLLGAGRWHLLRRHLWRGEPGTGRPRTAPAAAHLGQHAGAAQGLHRGHALLVAVCAAAGAG